MPFGQRLQEVRRKNGMTQEEFAAQLKVCLLYTSRCV